jgi:amino acid transporter
MPLIMSVWILAGVISFFGALACAELGAAFPSTGGQYVFLREAYGPAAAFLCGWSLFTVARSAQVAWMSVVFSIYASYLVPFGPLVSKLLSLAVLSVFAWVNYRGVKLGAIVQNSFTLAKTVGVLIIVAAALLQAPHAEHYARPGISSISLSSFGVALIACLLGYDGWVQLSFVAGEIRNPKRNMVRALTFGTLTVTAIYLLANFAYMQVLSVSEIAASEHVGADAAARTWGGGWHRGFANHSAVNSRHAQRVFHDDSPGVFCTSCGRAVFSELREDAPPFRDSRFRDLGAGGLVGSAAADRVIRIPDRLCVVRHLGVLRSDGCSGDSAAAHAA